MKKTTAPLLWDLDSNGNQAPTCTPGATPTKVTFNLSNLQGRVQDMWAKVQAVWVRLTFTLTQSTGTAVNADKLWQAMDSCELFSQVLGTVINQKSSQGAAMGLVDQVIGAGYKFPTPARAQIASADGDTTVDLYFRIPLALDWLRRPSDTGIWAPFFEKGRFDVYVGPTTSGLFQAGASIKAATATVRAAFEVIPEKTPTIHSAWTAARYEFNTSGNALKLSQFGSGNGLYGVKPGARISSLFWLSSNNGLGGVDTIDKWSRVGMQWRDQKITNNPEFYMAAFMAGLGGRVATVGSIAAGTINDRGGWPYTMAGGTDNGLLNSTGLFLPLIWPGRDSVLSGVQGQVGDLQIDAGFSSNPNGTHVFRTHEHFVWDPKTIKTLIDYMGFPLSQYTAEPKLEDNSSPGEIADRRQLRGIPLRIVKRSQAVLGVV